MSIVLYGGKREVMDLVSFMIGFCIGCVIVTAFWIYLKLQIEKEGNRG
jgi:uncharacterized membrane protein YciS (DUF1049 family)